MKKTFTYALICFCLPIFTNLAKAQYCPLTTGSPYSADMPGITGFTLNTINRTSLNIESSTGTVVNTGLTTSLAKGQTYSISIKHSEDAALFPGARNNLRVWIDYNNNSSFTDPGETVLSQNLQIPNTTFTGTFTVPYSATNGNLRLRATAKMSADAGHTFPSPCDVPADPFGYHGEMEDYTVSLSGTAPTATAYCDLPGRAPYSPGTPGITNFKLYTINRSSAAPESSVSIYVNTGLTTTLAVNKVYTVTLIHTKDIIGYPNARNNIRIWLDMNSNFAFDDPGEMLLSANQQSAGIFSGTIMIPATASLGISRMRVMLKQSADAGNLDPTPCDEPQDPQGLRGEVEDYNINIAATPPNLTGLSEAPANVSGLTLFPNPVSDKLTMAFNVTEKSDVLAELFDITGKRLKILCDEKDLSPAAHNYIYDLNKEYPAGIYYLRITINDSTINRKIVINRN